MDKESAADLTNSQANCGIDSTKRATTTRANKTELVAQWINESDFDDDSESILSVSTAASSSVVDSEDHDFDLSSMSLRDAAASRKMSSATTVSNRVDLLQHVLNKDSNVQTVGNVSIQNSSDVHIGNITHIHIVNPNERCMDIILNNNRSIKNKQRPKISIEREEEQVSEKEEANRDDAFLGNINRRIAEGVLRIIDRRTWVAQKPMEPYEYIDKPVELVIISHSATESATKQADNIYLIRNIQCFHVESCRWNDISYNFMIGSDGNVYQGRGWGVVGAHTKGYNTFSVGISFIGCFMRELPPPVSLKACQKIIQKGVDSGYIAPNYKLVGHCQCSPTESPGRKLFEEIKTWEHFSADF